jgi:putative cell wall-binding protein
MKKLNKGLVCLVGAITIMGTVSSGVLADTPFTSNPVSAITNTTYQGTTYTLSYTAGTGGTITGTASQQVVSGASGTSVTAVPNTGYNFVSWSDGVTTATRTDTPTTANINVTATFAAIPTPATYTLTYTAGTGGTITGTASQQVLSGVSGTAVTAVPNTGYNFVSWSDGKTTATRTDIPTTANISVTADFAVASTTVTTYTLTYTAGTGGTISGATTQSLAANTTGTPVTAVPNTGYKFVSWSDGSTSATRSDVVSTSNISLTALFSSGSTTTPITTTPPSDGSISVTRIAGKDRIETSVKVADSGWTQSDYAIVANAWDFPDAVSAAPLAYKYKAPVLLTDTDSLSTSTSAELTKLGVKNVFIVGGAGAVSDSTASQITALGITVQRLSGANRYATSVAIANAVGNTGSIVITNGYNPYEALSISPIAAKLEMPILLTARDTIPSEISAYLSSNTITKTYVLGKADGTTSDDGVSDNTSFPNPVRITGNNLYQRNININKLFSGDLDTTKVYLATGKSFADALSGSVLAATSGSPLVFVDNDMHQVTKDFLTSQAGYVSDLVVLGGNGAISDDTVQTVESLLDSTDSTTTPAPTSPTTPVTPTDPTQATDPVTTTPPTDGSTDGNSGYNQSTDGTESHKRDDANKRKKPRRNHYQGLLIQSTLSNLVASEVITSDQASAVTSAFQAAEQSNSNEGISFILNDLVSSGALTQDEAIAIESGISAEISGGNQNDGSNTDNYNNGSSYSDSVSGDGDGGSNSGNGRDRGRYDKGNGGNWYDN